MRATLRKFPAGFKSPDSRRRRTVSAFAVPAHQRRGIGTALLEAVRAEAETPLLVGTWADAAWAVRFYEKNRFTRVSPAEKDRLLRAYWSIPERQIATSVVLADAAWLAQRG